MIDSGATILFQGDSITDNGRTQEVLIPNHVAAMGWGYTGIVSGTLLEARPEDDLKFLNRGVSGNRIIDMYARWNLDAINLKPDILSILIGVNDTWHGFELGNGVDLKRFAAIYRLLLSHTREVLPAIKFVLCEPFVLKCGVVEGAWVDEIAQRQEVVRDLAIEFDAVLVPFQAALDAKLTEAPPEYWTDDGVHPTPAGHIILARCWMDTVC